MPPLDTLLAGARFLAAVPAFVRRPVTSDEARRVVRARLERRSADFLSAARAAVNDLAAGPYARLLRHAGCEPGDLDRLVAREGIEGALEALLREGVYLSVDEFKGRRPIVRGALSFRIDPGCFRNPALGRHLGASTGGTGGRATPVGIDLAAIRDWAINTRIEFDARGARRWVVARWSVPGGTAAAGILRFQAGSGVPLSRWFSPLAPDSRDLPLSRRWSTPLLRWGSRLGGTAIPRPEHVPLDDPRPIVDWLRHILVEGGAPFLVMHVSSAVRLAQAALDAGVDLSGACVLGTGEPLTSARRAIVGRAGIAIAASYASMEIGPLASGCLTPEAPDDVHVFDDLVALVQPPGAAGDPRPLYASTIRPSTPNLLLNVSLGDQAVASRRPCGCLLGEVGWTGHLRHIRSFEKLTAGGMTFLDHDVIRVLDELLPSRFGGAPTDYQLLEEEAGDGRPRLRLLVDPGIGPLDSRAVAGAFLEGLAAAGSTERVMGLAWNGVVEVVRRRPQVAESGKIQHLHVVRSTPERAGDPVSARS